jgi:hypothetical protein
MQIFGEIKKLIDEMEKSRMNVWGYGIGYEIVPGV